MTQHHIPILVQEIVEWLVPSNRTIERIIDGTIGAGGHSQAFLEAGVRAILGIDLDQQALQIAQQNLEHYHNQIHLVQDSYLHIRQQAQAVGWQQVDGILLDLGVSSMQLDTPERGFAFRHDGDLDMRFDPHSNTPPASEIVNYWEANELADIFFRYGEEKNSRHLAKAIVRNRPFQTTQQLAQVIANATPKKKRQQSTIHPATRIFQALRIVVNNELQVIEQALPLAIDLLQPGGRLAVISFHSLEDRIVKQVFKEASTEIVAPPGMASMPEKEAIVKLITRKPIIPSATEIERNPRSRSAKLRVIEKL